MADSRCCALRSSRRFVPAVATELPATDAPDVELVASEESAPAEQPQQAAIAGGASASARQSPASSRQAHVRSMSVFALPRAESVAIAALNTADDGSWADGCDSQQHSLFWICAPA